MLVLTRQPHYNGRTGTERNRVVLRMPDGSRVVVVVLEVRGDLVRLGVEAPRDVKVLRRELVQPDDEGV